MKEYVEEFRLKGKTVVILGGCGLLGREIVNAFCQTEAKVIILDIDKESANYIIQNTTKKNIIFKYFDVSDIQGVDEFFNQLKEDIEYIDVFVNVSYPKKDDWGKSVEETSLKCLRENVDVHLNSYCWISRKICLLMKEKGGSLINFASIYGIKGNDFNVYEGTDMSSPMEYSVIKAGIINLTRYLASYFGKYQVRVNTVSPGGVYNHQNKIFVQNYCNKTPLKRMANPQDIAGAVVFLASDLSTYMTGQNIVIDGGWSIC